MNLNLPRGSIRAAALFIVTTLFVQNALAAPPSVTGAPVTAAIPGIGESVTFNLRELGVIAGSAPLVVGAEGIQVLVNGQPEPLLETSVFPNNGPGHVCVNIFNLDIALNPGDTYALQLDVGSLSGSSSTGPQVVSITNTPGSVVDTPAEELACNDPNTSPVANAGPDRVVADTDAAPGESVVLDGSASSDVDVGTILSYQWLLNDSPLAPASTSPTLTTNLPDGAHEFLLIVTDDSEDSATESNSVLVTITVNAPQVPTANAGTDQTVPDTDGQAGEPVTLTGSATDSDGTISTYEWLLGQTLLGSGATLQTTLPDGVNTVTLRVTDNAGNTMTDTVQITVGAAMLPVANAGPDQTVQDTEGLPGELVTLTGSGTDPDGTIASYTWLLGESSIGTGATLEVSLPDGVNLVTLLVTDNDGNTATDTVQITVAAPPEASVLSEIPNLTPEQQKTAVVVDRVCSDVSSMGEGSMTPDQQQLLERCNGLLFDNSAANQVAALDELIADDFAVARTQTLVFANTQHGSVMDRLIALRGGAKGLSLAGLNVIVEGKTIPLAQLQDMAKSLLGGGASADSADSVDSADEPGGLLSDKWGLWARGNYSFGKKDANSQSPAFKADQWALVGGVDYRVTNNAVIGGSLAYGNASVNFKPSGEGALDTESWAASLYGSMYAAKSFYVDGIVNVANSSYDARRNITYVDGAGLVDVDANGSTDGLTLSGGLSGGYDFLAGGFTISPNLGFFYIDTTIDGFTEEGAAGLNLIYDEQNFKSLTGNLGLRVAYAWNTSWGVVLPHLRVDFVREFEDDVDVFGVRFAADPNATSAPPILVETENPDTSYWRLATGVSAQFKYGFSGYVEYQRLESFEFLSFEDVSVGLRMQRSF